MNQANTVCLIAIILFMGYITYIMSFGAAPAHLGTWGPIMMATCLPLVSYGLGRIWERE